MTADHDAARLQRLSARTEQERASAEAAARYNRWLQFGMSGMDDMAQLGFVSVCGKDSRGRPIVLFVGRNFSVRTVDLSRALAYSISLIDPIVNEDYLVVYLHTDTNSRDLPEFSWLRQVYDMLDDRSVPARAGGRCAGG